MASALRNRFQLNYLACEWVKRLLKYAERIDADLLDENTVQALRGERRLASKPLKCNSLSAVKKAAYDY